METQTWTGKQGIAERYDFSLRHVSNLMKRRILPYSKIGRVVRFNIARCDQAMMALEKTSVLLGKASSD